MLTLLSMAMVCHAAPAPSYELYNYGASCVSTNCALLLQVHVLVVIFLSGTFIV